MEKNLICIVCPMGCPLVATVNESGAVVSVTGNTCKRGEAYAKDELTHPVRTLTTTVKTVRGRLVSVKSKTPVPKESLFLCMKEINATVAAEPIKIGDVIVRNVAGTGVDIVATSE